MEQVDWWYYNGVAVEHIRMYRYAYVYQPKKGPLFRADHIGVGDVW